MTVDRSRMSPRPRESADTAQRLGSVFMANQSSEEEILRIFAHRVWANVECAHARPPARLDERVGRTGKSFLARAILGSVAVRVVKLAHCDVLVVA
jgi:hypothetical protein